MSITGLAFVALFFGGLFLAFYKPIFGLCVYVLTFYNNPANSWWGSALPDLRWSLLAAVVTAIALIVSRIVSPSSSAEVPRFRLFNHLGFWLLLAFVMWCAILSLWAVDGIKQADGLWLVIKFLILFVLITGILTDAKSLELFVWAHVLGAFTWGWTAYRMDVHGRFEPMLGPGMNDANELGFQIVTALAFAGYMVVGLRGWRRYLAFAVVPFLVNVVILTASRSALLGLIAAGAAAAFSTPRKHRRAVLICAMLGVLLFLRLAGSELFWQRAATIGDSDVEAMDASAAARLSIAQANWKMFLDYPMGTGFRGDFALSPRYIPPDLLTEGGRSAHSTLLAALVDTGLPGTAIFFSLFLWGGLTLHRVRVSADNRTALVGLFKPAVVASLVAYCICGLFINLLTSEVWVWMLALIPVLRNLSWPNTPMDGQSQAHTALRSPEPPVLAEPFSPLSSGR